MIVLPEIDRYCDQWSGEESELCRELRLVTIEKFSGSEMICGPQLGGLLRSFVHALNAKRILEIGTYTGYSALMMGEAFHSETELITIEKSLPAIHFAQSFFERSVFGSQIKIHEGQALQVLETLSGDFDLVFIDADKANTFNYYEWALKHLSSHGVIVVDDVLWRGEVLNPHLDKRAQGMHDFNQALKQDSRVRQVLLPIRHGVQVIFAS